MKSKTPLRDFFYRVLESQTGAGKRYQSYAHFMVVAGALLNHYGESEDILSPDRDGLTPRQSMLLCSLLGYSDPQLQDFRQYVRACGKENTDFSSGKPLKLADVVSEVDRLIKELVLSPVEPKLPLPPAPPKPLPARPKISRIPKPPKPSEPPPASPKISAPPISRESPKPIAKKKPFFPIDNDGNEIKGQALLTYALAKNTAETPFIFGQLLEEMRGDVSKAEFMKFLGITDKQNYLRFITNTHKKPSLELLNTIATALGAETYEDKGEWRKYMLGVPPEKNQDALNHCFEPGTPHAIDTETPGHGHSIAVAKFIRLLADCHGAVDRAQLTYLMAAKMNLDPPQRVMLERTIHNIAGPIANEKQDTSVMDRETLMGSDGRGKTMPQNMAQQISAFAFPDDPVRQQQCNDFLTSEKYRTPEDLESAHRSAAMTALRQEHGTRWAKSTRITEQDTTPDLG